MAEIGSQWFNPFDPQDPDAVASAAVGTSPRYYAAQQAEAPPKRLAIYRKPVQVQSPQQRVSGGFGAMDVEDRSQPGYPGAFLYSGAAFDPNEAKMVGTPVDPEGGAFSYKDVRAPTVEDYFNPLSQEAGIMNIYPAAERIRQAEQQRIAESQKKYKWTEEDQKILDEMQRKHK